MSGDRWLWAALARRSALCLPCHAALAVLCHAVTQNCFHILLLLPLLEFCRASCKFENVCLNSATDEFEFYQNTDLYPSELMGSWECSCMHGWRRALLSVVPAANPNPTPPTSRATPYPPLPHCHRHADGVRAAAGPAVAGVP